MTTTTDTMTWKDVLGEEKKQPYFKAILDFVKKERAAGKRIYPPHQDMFNALKFTPYENVKVVILGQDPYHGAGQAHGLAFSVLPGIPFPPSLQNIFKELQSDIGIPKPHTGCLEKWAQQGVLLLNAALSVEDGKPQAHANIGWHPYHDNQTNKGVFLMWDVSARYEKQGKDSVGITGGKRLSTGPVFVYYQGGMMLRVEYKYPLYEDVIDTQLSHGQEFSLGLGLVF